MTYFRKDLRFKVAEFSGMPERVEAVYQYQDGISNDRMAEAKELGPEYNKAFFDGMINTLKHAIKSGENGEGLVGATRFCAKANAWLYSEKEYFFDKFTKQPFRGAKTIAGCREYLVEESYGSEWASLMHLYSGAFRNIVIDASWEDAEGELKVLLAEVKKLSLPLEG
jgi:hypothetical protein